MQRSRIVLITDLQQAEQIDDLMVTPVTDIRPRVLGFDHLVVQSLVGDAIGVVAVGRRGVEKLGNNMVDIERITVGEGFPVLEYVTPVALVSHHRLALLVLHADRE